MQQTSIAPYFDRNDKVLWQGNVIDVLNQLPRSSVQTIVTSPPYYGLRAYGTDPQVWGGDPECNHVWIESGSMPPPTGGTIDENPADPETGYRRPAAWRNAQWAEGKVEKPTARCAMCDAWFGELGSESHPDAFVEHLASVFDAARPVLNDWGTAWINLADSYSGSGKGPTGFSGVGDQAKRQGFTGKGKANPSHNLVPAGYQAKDQYLVPYLFARAMQKRGWTLRTIIIWHKLTPMPESVLGWRWERHRIKVEDGKTKRRGDPSETGVRNNHHDTRGLARWEDCPGCKTCEANDGLVLRRGSGRPTNSWEPILVFSKGKTYYYDSVGVMEPAISGHSSGNGFVREGRMQSFGRSGANAEWQNSPLRNQRNVWTLGPENAKFAHFATFPTEIPRRAIRAATSEAGQCADCGSPLARVVRRSGSAAEESDEEEFWLPQEIDEPEPTYETLGWRKTCRCTSEGVARQIVLDPFSGSGTSIQVARELNRVGWGVELKQEYCEIAVRHRLSQDTLF